MVNNISAKIGSLTIGSAKISNSSNRNIDDFGYFMESKLSNRFSVYQASNNKGKHEIVQKKLLSAELRKDEEQIECQYELNEKDVSELQSGEKYINVINHAIDKKEYEGLHAKAAITVKTIADLANLYERVIYQCNQTNNTNWQFTYIDSKINVIDLEIKKINNNNLMVSISPHKASQIQISNILSRLHERLSIKGWSCCITERAVNGKEGRQDNDQ